MNNVTFTKAQGGLGRPLAGEDHYSGIVYYTPNATVLPTGWGTSKYRQIADVADLESKGVLSTTTHYRQLHYHVSEFFRINPNGILYVAIETEPVSGNIDFEGIRGLQGFAANKIRQFFVYVSGETFAASQVTAIQGIVTALAAIHAYCSVIFTADISGVTDLTTLADLRALAAPAVSVVIGEDGGGVGAALAATLEVTVGCGGACLGAISRASVHENIAWVKKFDMSDGTELEAPAFGNGDLVSEEAAVTITGLNTKGYIFLIKHIGISGTYFNDSHCSIPVTSDYAYIENTRTIDKAIRGIRTYLLPELNSPLYVDQDTGTLSVDTCKYFERLAANALEQMARNGEVSGFDVNVDPEQDVLTSSELNIAAAIVPVGVAREIKVNIGFTLKIQS